MVTAFLFSLVFALLALLHFVVSGSAILRHLLPQHARQNAEWPWLVFFSLCLGMWLNMAGLFALSLAGHLHLWGVLIMAGSLFALGLVQIKWRPWRFEPAPTGDGRVALALQLAVLAVILLLTVVASLQPPGHWDDTLYHLPLARHYVLHQGLALPEHLRFPLFPQNMNLLFAAAMILGEAATPDASVLWQPGAPERFAQLLATLPLFILAVGLWAASRRFLRSGLPGLIAALALFPLLPVKITLGYAYVDDGLAMFCFAAALAVAWAAELPRGQRVSALFALAGLLAGAACGTKYFGVVFCTLLGFVVLGVAGWRGTCVSGAGKWQAVASAGLPYAAAAVLAGIGWYVRSYVVSGDPIHPAGGGIFGHYLWNAQDLAAQHAEQATHGVGKNLLKLPAALAEAGVLLWMAGIAGLFLKGLPPAIRVMQAAFVAYLLFWFFVTQVYRYLAPLYGVASFLSVHFLWWAGTRWIRWRAWGRVTGAQQHAFVARDRQRSWVHGLLLVLALGYFVERSFKHVGKFVHAETVLARIPGYDLYQQANMHRQEHGDRLVQVGFEKGKYFFRGTVIGDWFGPGRYTDILACSNMPCPLPTADMLASQLETHDARMLLLSREVVPAMDEAALLDAGWRVLAQDTHGLLLSRP